MRGAIPHGRQGEVRRRSVRRGEDPLLRAAPRGPRRGGRRAREGGPPARGIDRALPQRARLAPLLLRDPPEGAAPGRGAHARRARGALDPAVRGAGGGGVPGRRRVMRGGRGDDLEAYLVSAKRLVDRELDRRLPGLDESPRALHRAMRYAVFPGGKRLRPALALLMCETFRGKSSDALPAAAALEMIHTYSLIHDDLPCMDDDDFRRGRPTLHRVFGEAMAVLAGDALHTAAFRAVAACRRQAVPSPLEALVTAAGSPGMVGGQVDDLAAEGKRPSLGRVRSIHSRKTAALLAASAECGAICAGAGRKRVKEASEFGRTLGLAFQIADDVLDVVGTRGRLGKTPGKDARSKKMTYPACVGLDRSRAQAGALAARAERRARTLPARRRDLLVALARFAHERTS